MRYFRAEEVHLIVSACTSARYKWFWQILWRTGARCSEALLLGFADLQDDHILVPTLKQRKGRPPYRVVPVQPDFLVRFKSAAWAWKRGGAQIFPFTKQASWAALQLAKKNAGLPPNDKRAHHAFRHGFAKLCLDQGVDLRDLQRYLGHSSIGITSKYLTVTEDHLTRLHRVDFGGPKQLTLIKGGSGE